MKKNRTISILVILIMAAIMTGKSQEFLMTQGKAIVNESGQTILLKAMGLGGWMLQEGYMMQTAEFANAQHEIRKKIEEVVDVDGTDAFYTGWLKNHVQKQDIDSLKSWGFNAVRLPMHFNLFTLPIEEESIAGEHTWLEIGFELTDSLISWCKQNQLYVILDLHAAPGGQGKDEGISDYDPSKPSLWEDERNKEKTIALWKRIAERYSNEPTVAGYDLINETNWNLNGNTSLRNLYIEITNAIRAVDMNHMLFIEGNWFANDFTNLTPPWDQNMVYSPHKYWSINDQASIQWALDIREMHNVPIFFGESGENSNVWFRDAIKLFADHDIGWAWWPMKKIGSISGPLSITTPDGYQDLLDYWKGEGTKPSKSVAMATLMDLTEKVKIENCRFQKDVIDAMFRQVETDQTIPFKNHVLPGIIYSPDYDLGNNGEAYWDNQVADYKVSTGNFTAWNNGWVYRNDGVDLDKSEDNINSNGYHVGWLQKGEWMQYSINVPESAVFDINVRVASNEQLSKFYIASGRSDISNIQFIGNTGGGQNWATIPIYNVILTTQDSTLRFYMEGGDFNVGSFEFIKKQGSNLVNTDFVNATTSDKNHVEAFLNKPLITTEIPRIEDFSILVNGSERSIQSIEIDTNNSRVIIIEVDPELQASDVILISYNGDNLKSSDATRLLSFNLRDVRNTLTKIHPIPGKIEMEDFSSQSGIQVENTSDLDGGQNIGHLDAGDFLDYNINVLEAGRYQVDFRTASKSEEGQVELHLLDENGGLIKVLSKVAFAPTGGWQNWETNSADMTLPEGNFLLRVMIAKSLFNMNWMEFKAKTTRTPQRNMIPLRIFPNPVGQAFHIQADLKDLSSAEIQILNIAGKLVYSRNIRFNNIINENLHIPFLPSGNYVVNLMHKRRLISSQKFIKK